MKNILLVMQSGGYLAPPEEKPDQAELWNETWKRLDRFLPNLHKELYPDEQPVQKANEIVEKGEGSEDGEGDVKTSVGTFVKS